VTDARIAIPRTSIAAGARERPHCLRVPAAVQRELAAAARLGRVCGRATGGYYLATSAGNAYPFNTPFYGSQAGKNPPSPVIGITAAG
jgi:hypothetical protein